MYTKDELLEKIRPAIDPELGFSVVDMGLIYEVEQDSEGLVKIAMTLTSPACPIGPQIANEVRKILEGDDQIKGIDFTWSFDPPWDPKTMASEDIQWELGIF